MPRKFIILILVAIFFLLGSSFAIALEPADEYYNQQYYLRNIKIDKAWDIITGSPDITIAIVDSGVDINHPDLKNNIWRNYQEIPGNNIDDDHNGYIDDVNGWDFVANTNDPSPKFGDSYSFLGMNHGTIIAGVAAAQGDNHIGITGISWSSRIMPLRVLAADGTGSTEDVANAIDYAVQNKADIINLSFVGEGKSRALADAIERAYKAGIIIIAAAGNEVDKGIDMTISPRYPVCHDGPNGENWVIGVASVDKYDRLASFSNYGKCIDLVTPGVGIFSTLYKTDDKPRYNHYYGGLWSGTSISTPQVAGLVALIKSLKPTFSLFEIQRLLFNNTDNIDHQNMLYTNQLGYGKINALKVITATLNTTSRAEANIDKIVTGPVENGSAHIRSFKGNTAYTEFYSFDQNKTHGSNVAVYDLDQDGLEEVIATGAKGETPQVKIFDIKGNIKSQFLALEPDFKGGLYSAVGDVDNDGQNEIIVVPGADHTAVVKIFNQTGGLKQEFYAFNKFFIGGIRVAVGDVNNDGFDEIIIAAGRGTSSYVKIFNSGGLLLNQFIAYDPAFMAGITVAVGDLDGNGIDEIITGTKAGGGPHVRVFDSQGRLKNEFLAYHPNFRGGVNVAVGDIDGNGISEIITGAGPGGGPHVRVFGPNNKVLVQFMAYHPNFRGGVNVAAGK